MQNLIPLQLDKVTGKIFAKEIAVNSGTFQVTGFTQEFGVASATWNINHNGSTTFVMVQIFDESAQEIMSDTVSIIDLNNITITFSEPQLGTALLLLFTPNV